MGVGARFFGIWDLGFGICVWFIFYGDFGGDESEIHTPTPIHTHTHTSHTHHISTTHSIYPTWAELYTRINLIYVEFSSLSLSGLLFDEMDSGLLAFFFNFLVVLG